jgi:hypothetical protein
VACLGSDLEVVIPTSLVGLRDLAPLPVKSLDEVLDKFRAANPALTSAQIELTVR